MKKEKRQTSELACRYPYSPKDLRHRLSSGGVGIATRRQAATFQKDDKMITNNEALPSSRFQKVKGYNRAKRCPPTVSTRAPLQRVTSDSSATASC
jgi:hypothetical protein